MTIRLYDETPQHRDNFVKLVEAGFYNDLLFHRVSKDFLVYGGDSQSKGAAAEAVLGNDTLSYTIPAEFFPAHIHKKGALVATRQADAVNPSRASSASQFALVVGKIQSDAELDDLEKNRGISFTPEQRNIYRTQGGTPHLDGNYTVFGEIISGIEALHKIAAVKTGANDRPEQDLKMRIKVISE